jgi:acetyltransferase-like isoleucine patch superfamily enzyme
MFKSIKTLARSFHIAKSHFSYHIFRGLHLSFLNFKWRIRNPNNFTDITNEASLHLTNVGDYSYGTINIWSYGDSGEALSIGNFVSIAANVQFILGGDHPTDCISPYPFSVFNPVLNSRVTASSSKGPIVVEDHVWIGHSSTILAGVRIGIGSIIGACSTVTRDIPPFSIAVGSPAKVVKIKDISNDERLMLVSLTNQACLDPRVYSVLTDFSSQKVPLRIWPLQ